MRSRPEFRCMPDEFGGSLAQNRIDVRLVQKDSYFYKSVRGSDLQHFSPHTAGIKGLFNPENCPAGTPHYLAEFAFCIRQTDHVLSLQRQKARRTDGRRLSERPPPPPMR